MNRECIEFRHGLADGAASRDELLCLHVERCPDCAAYLEERLKETPTGLKHSAWESAPPSLNTIILNTIKSGRYSISAESPRVAETPQSPPSDFWRMLLAGLSGLAVAAAVFLLMVRTPRMPGPALQTPVQSHYSFLDSEGRSFSDYSFIEDPSEEINPVTDESLSDSNNWTFLESSSNFSFLENDKEALWEDQSSG